MSFSFTNWLKTLTTNFIGARRHHPRWAPRPRRTIRLGAELLEDRVTPATFMPLVASFTGDTGSSPVTGGLVMDGAGNLFGTTQFGGTSNQGTLFELATRSSVPQVTTVASFGGFVGAMGDVSGLVMDGSGNLFGTAEFGGAFGGPVGYGTVFEMAAGSSIITPLAFFDGVHGAYPGGGLVIDDSGNLFGTAHGGGTYGEVFEVAAGSSIVTTLATFNGDNGAFPSSLVMDGNGNLFGTTVNGGATGAGTVFEVAAGSSVPTTLASFDGTTDGSGPTALLRDGKGNLFGTAEFGGDLGLGTVFELTAGIHAITPLASFNGSTTGASPYAGLVMDGGGNLFGTTLYQGSNTGVGFGTVFELAPGSQLRTLATFERTNGGLPIDLVMDSGGNLFGTTAIGGPSDLGTVFEIAGAGTPTFSLSQATKNLLALVNSSNLASGTQNSLDAKLNAAIAAFDRGNATAGDNQLKAFINEVNAQRGKKIDDALADLFIADAEDIITA
jgi:uncharacterized repeat protein (TIGR03803 family)